MSYPAWTAWAVDGSEHRFRLRAGQGGAVTLHVDNRWSTNVLGSRVSGGTLDVTSYGGTGKSFVSTKPDRMVVELPGGTVELDVGDLETHHSPRSHAVSDTHFTGTIHSVTLDSAPPRGMRDSPPSEDVTIPCVSCSADFPPAGVSWTSDPYASEIHGDVVDEGWWCEDCYNERVMEV